MEITKLSTKGQIVIPEIFGKGFDVGTPFVVSKRENMIVLKVVEGLSSEEEKELIELEKIWKDIDSGKAKSYSEEEFFNEMKKW